MPGDVATLFGRLDARKDLVDVDGKRARLESTYLRVVREWGQSIESADSYTHGHCERVATLGEAVGRLLGLDEEQLTALRLGAYLHDLGKVKVPHEILNKPGKLTDEEFDRATGDRTKQGRHVGRESVHVCIDDHSRLAFAQVMPDRAQGHHGRLP